jgi:hypothetical protein
MGSWALMVGFGAYHGLNPGMGWLFALALGLQQKNERAIWRSMLPITAGHAASIVLVAVLVTAAGHWVSIMHLRYLAASALLVFAVFKMFNLYRHPRWVGMRVGMKDLCVWSFLMATAHGAGLMVAPTLLEVGQASAGPETTGLTAAAGLVGAVLLHTAAMLTVMLITALVVFRKLGLAILRRRWVNFDAVWAVALFIVGGTALYHATRMAAA